MILDSNICTYPKFQTTYVVDVKCTYIYITLNNPRTTVSVKCGDGSKELVILSHAIVCFHPSMLLNNENNSCEISKDKIAVCEKTASLWSKNFLDLT